MDSTVDSQPQASIELLRSLVPAEKIRQLASSRSDSQGLLQSAFHIACACITGLLVHQALATNSSAGISYCLAIVLHGFVLSFLFMPLHEAVHHTAFASAALNRGCAWLTGFLTMRPPYSYT